MKHHFRFNKEIMNQFFCFRCSRIITSAEGLRCPQCDRDEYGSVMAANLYSAIPGYENSSSGYHVPAEHASTQESKEGFMQEEPTREASTQISDDYSDSPLQIDEGHGHENSTNSDSSFQIKTAHDFDFYTDENQNRLPSNSITNEGKFHNLSYGICYSSTSPESVDVTYAASQQAYPYEQSSLSECKNNQYFDELPRRHGIVEPTVLISKVDKLDFKGKKNCNPKKPYVCRVCGRIFLSPVTMLGHECVRTGEKPSKSTQCDFERARRENLKHAKTHTNLSPSFSSSPRRNPSGRKYFQERLVTKETDTTQKSQSSSKLSKRKCPKCKRPFVKEAILCNCSLIRYKCNECDGRFPNVFSLIMHKRAHTEEKPFKCNQCDYAAALLYNLEKHMEKHRQKLFEETKE